MPPAIARQLFELMKDGSALLFEPFKKRYALRLGAETVTYLCVDASRDDGTPHSKEEFGSNWPWHGGHKAESLQSAARFLQKLVAKDWRGAALRDPWAAASSSFSLIYVPGSCTKGVDISWIARLPGSRAIVSSLPDGTGLATERIQL